MTSLFTTGDLAVIAPVLVADAGHLGCGTWSVDSRDGILTCCCGTALFVLAGVGR